MFSLTTRQSFPVYCATLVGLALHPFSHVTVMGVQL